MECGKVDKVPWSLAYQYPAAVVVASFQREHKLVKSVGNAEHFVLGAWALKAAVNNLAVPEVETSFTLELITRFFLINFCKMLPLPVSCILSIDE